MASISTSEDGKRVVQFVAPDGRRRSIRLGRVTMKNAEETKRRIEYLLGALTTNSPIDLETAKWLAGVPKSFHRRLAKLGLIQSLTGSTDTRLKSFCNAYIEGRTDAKPRTILNLKMFRDRLVTVFGADRELGTIKPSDADAWLIDLKSKYAPATVGRSLKGARQFFRAAIRAELILKNPFADLKAGSAPDKDRQYFISQEDIRRVIDACPNAEWRLIVALSRYGGLRCPSEHLELTWGDIDWERNRFVVRSPKTEHHEGKGERIVPLFAELRPYLEQAFGLAAEGAVYVIASTWNSSKNLRTRMTKIIRRAHLTPWPKIFHNLRASRQTELSAQYPIASVCRWLGNSVVVADRHYLQVMEADFARAAESGALQPGGAAIALQHVPAETRKDSKRSEQTQDSKGDMQVVSAGCENVRGEPKSAGDEPIRPEGVEPPTYGSEDRCSVQLSYGRV
jgi:integrase